MPPSSSLVKDTWFSSKRSRVQIPSAVLSMKLNPLKFKAMELREEGKSYGEILKILGLTSKGTLAAWFKNIKLTDEAQKRLKNNMLLAYKRGLFEFNRKRTEDIIIENSEILQKYKEKVKSLSSRDLMLIGAALYWGEGHKNFENGKQAYPTVNFSNSDPDMVMVFMEFLRRVLKIPLIKIKPSVYIYPGMSYDKSVQYWSKITGVPSDIIPAYTALSRASQGKRPKNLLPYGTLQIRVNRRQEFFKIRGLMDGIIKAAKL